MIDSFCIETLFRMGTAMIASLRLKITLVECKIFNMLVIGLCHFQLCKWMITFNTAPLLKNSALLPKILDE